MEASGDVVHGLRELIAGFDDFPEKLRRRGLNAVMRAGGKVVVLSARGRVAKVSGALARSIRVSVVRSSDGSIARIFAGPRKGKAAAKDAPHYAVMVEKGTKAHEIRPKHAKSLFLAGVLREVVHHPGSKAQPYLGPALSENVDAILNAMAAECEKQIEKLGRLV